MSTPFALYTLDYPPEHGGVARYLGDLVETTSGEMDVFVPETHAISGPGRVHNLPSFSRGMMPWRRLIWSLRGLKKGGYRALFLSHALPVGTAALLARCLGGLPYTILVHGLDVRLAVAHPRRRWILRQVLAHAATVFVNSQAVAREVLELESTLQPIVVTPGVKPRSFVTRGEARQQLGIASEDYLCLTVARLVARKGIDTMLAELKALPKNVHYVILGDGADRPRLEAFIAQHRLESQVTMVTNADDATRDLWFAAADVFIFLAREEGIDLEGFGMVCLEASMAGLPILAGNTGGVSEAVVDNETGLLVETNDVTQIQTAFARLYNDASLRAQLGAAGRERAVRDFTWEDRWQLIRTHLARL